METRIEPRLITVLRAGYTRGLFARDLGAGVIAGVPALPRALTRAIIAHMEAEKHP